MQGAKSIDWITETMLSIPPPPAPPKFSKPTAGIGTSSSMQGSVSNSAPAAVAELSSDSKSVYDNLWADPMQATTSSANPAISAYNAGSYSSYTAGQPSAYPSSYYPVPYNNYPSTQSSFTSIVNPPPKPTYQYTQPSQIGQQQIPSNLSQQGSNTATYQYTQSFAGPPPSSSHLPQQGNSSYGYGQSSQFNQQPYNNSSGSSAYGAATMVGSRLSQLVAASNVSKAAAPPGQNTGTAVGSGGYGGAVSTTYPSYGVSGNEVAGGRRPHVSRFSTGAQAVTSTTTAGGMTGTTTASSTGTKKMSPSCEDFVTRCFQVCDTDEKRGAMAIALEKIINKVASEGRMMVHSWVLEQIPQLPGVGKTDAKGGYGLNVQTSSYYENRSGNSSSYGPSQGDRLSPFNQDKKRKSRWEEKEPRGAGSSSPALGLYGPGSYGPSKGSSSSTSPRSSSQRGDQSSSDARWGKYGGNGGHSDEDGEDDGDGDYGKSSSSSYGATSSSRSDNQKNKKKKKGEIAVAERQLTSAEQAIRERRANRFQKDYDEDQLGKGEYVPPPPSAAEAMRRHRKMTMSQRGGVHGRGGASYYGSDTLGDGPGADVAFDVESLKVVGTCQKLEKDYFRLTSAPPPNTVRPENILRQALELVKGKWERDEVEYIYMCSQFKSIRQDLTVQHIQNDFTVEVYETHARVALECEDLNEYNQCQTQLKQLYNSGKKSKEDAEMEFVAYRILYYVYLQGNKKYQNGSADLADIMKSLRPEQFNDPAVAHALQIRRAVQLDNYHQYFILRRSTPHLGNCILDLMIDARRLHALQRICRGYKPTVPVDFVLSALDIDVEEGPDLLRKAGCVLEVAKPDGDEEGDASGSKWEINTKDSVIDMSVVFSNDKLLL